MDLTLAEKVLKKMLKKTPLDLQKRFPICVSQILGGPLLRLGITV